MLQTLDGFMRRLSKYMAYLAGMAFLLLGIFMAFDTLSRRLGGPFTGVTDAIASLVMVFGATWTLAYALATDAHVKIDVMTGFYSPRVTRFTLLLAMLTTTIFASVLAWQAWAVTWTSWQRGAYLPLSLLEMHLAWPQAVGAIGYTVLLIQGLVVLAVEVLKAGEKRT